MKNKVLTFLMSLLMIIPLAGCGERNIEGDPKENEAKVVLRFAEIKDSVVVENQSDLTYRYSDCAELIGQGFYEVGTSARVSINYDKRACDFSGWVVGGNVHTSNIYSHRIESNQAGQTINIYALMAKNGNAAQLNDTSLNIDISSISVTSYNYGTGVYYELESIGNTKTVTIPTNVRYRYVAPDPDSDDDYGKFVYPSENTDAQNAYEISEGASVEINGISYTVNYDQTDTSKVVSLTVAGSENEVYTLDAQNKVIVVEDYTYEYDPYEGLNGGFSRNGQKFTISSNGVVTLSDTSYEVVRDGSNQVTGLTEFGNRIEEETKSLVNAADLIKYNLPAAPGGTSITFATMIDTIENGSHKQGITLGSLFEGTNLSYFTIKENGPAQLQHYKIKWKYSEGPCGTPSTDIVDPNTFEFRSGMPNYCLSANIDLRSGITDQYIEDAVKSTLLNQMYIYSDPTESVACAGPEDWKATSSISEDCMFVRNLALLGDVIYPTPADAAEKGYKIFYYGVNTGNKGEVRLESVESQIDNALIYKSQTRQEGGFSKKAVKTAYNSENLDNYNLKIGEIYKTLAYYYDNPREAIEKVNFGFSRVTNDVVIESMQMGETRYYFNYVNNATSTFYYKPETGEKYEIGQTEQNALNLYRLEDFDVVDALEDDKAKLRELETRVRQNTENLMGAADSSVKTTLEEAINYFVNTAYFKNLRKYEFVVKYEDSKFTVKVINRSIEIIEDYWFALDNLNKLSFLKYVTEGTKLYDVERDINILKSSVTYNLDTMLKILNLLSDSSDEILDGATLKISSTIDYVDYAIYIGNDLKIRLRSRTDNGDIPTFELIDPYNPSKVEFSIVLKEASEVTNDFSGGVNNIILDGFELVKLETTRVENLYKLNKVELGDDIYYLDLANNKVYDASFNEVSTIMPNIGTEFNRYFVIDDEFYALSEKEGTKGVSKIVIDEGSATLEEQIPFEEGIYVYFDGSEYAVTNPDSDNPTITIGEDVINLTVSEENENCYQITVEAEEPVITGVTGNNPDIKALYNFLVNSNTKYYSVDGKTVAVNGNSVYTLDDGVDTNDGIYSVTYNNLVYTVTFNEPVDSE